MIKKKVLVIRFSSIGDIILTTPVFRCLVKQAGAEVHLLTKASMSSLLKHNTYVSSIHSLGESMSDCVSGLKSESFDYVIDLQNNLKSHRITKGLGLPYSRVNKLNVQKWLLVNAKINRLPEKHIVDRYLEAGSSFNLINDNQGLDYFLPNDDQAVFVSIVDKYQLPSTYVCIVIGAAHLTKQIPVDKIVEIVNKLEYQAILIGGPGDVEKSQEIVGQSPASCINLVGKLSIDESAIVIDRSRVVVTSDTGMMHIAAARKRPIVSIWGNTVPEFGMYPYMPSHIEDFAIIEQQGLSCRPCSKIGYNSCPKGHFKCMNDMNIDTIVDKIRSFI